MIKKLFDLPFNILTKMIYNIQNHVDTQEKKVFIDIEKISKMIKNEDLIVFRFKGKKMISCTFDYQMNEQKIIKTTFIKDRPVVLNSDNFIKNLGSLKAFSLRNEEKIFTIAKYSKILKIKSLIEIIQILYEIEEKKLELSFDNIKRISQENKYFMRLSYHSWT